MIAGRPPREGGSVPLNLFVSKDRNLHTWVAEGNGTRVNELGKRLTSIPPSWQVRVELSP